jgi:glycosyltransferase involved in cell wall biosynthesis
MKVSVALITYNHEKFIDRAIDSIIMQQVIFDCEIVIGEDCSTDNTRNIVSEFYHQYPDKISLFLPEVKLGKKRNIEAVLQKCQGDYIALLDGDDYWISAEKLQKQVNFLDDRPNCSICFHDALLLFEDEKRTLNPSYLTNRLLSPKDQIFDLEDLLTNQFYRYTGTTMFRNHLFSEFPEWYFYEEETPYDYPIFVFNAQYGQIGYIHEVLSIYRIHSQGVWSKKTRFHQCQCTINNLQYLNKHLNFKYEKIIDRRIASYYYEMAGESRKQGDLFAVINLIIRCFMKLPKRKFIHLIDFLILILSGNCNVKSKACQMGGRLY